MHGAQSRAPRRGGKHSVAAGAPGGYGPTMSNASNPMLIFTIHDALRQSEHDLEGSVWHAAVHGMLLPR